LRYKRRKEVLDMRNLLIKKDRYMPFFGGFDMERVFDSFFERPFHFNLFSEDRVPLVDLYEKDNKVIVKAELPGIKPEEAEILVDGNLLTIRGEKKQEKEEKKKDYYRLERCYGSFQRIIELPASVNADQAKATYKDGVLELELPKAEEEKKKKIKINVN